jgi:PAS domain S-box-containing protein
MGNSLKHYRNDPKVMGGKSLQGRDKLFKQLEGIYHSSFDGIWICDGQGIILGVNPASERINELKAEDWIGRPINELVVEGYIDRSVTMEVLKKKRQVTIIQKAKNTQKKLLVTGTPIFGDNGHIEMVVTNDRDCTELDNMRLKLIESEARSERYQHELLKREAEESVRNEFVCKAPAMTKLLSMATHVARFKTNILFTGPSGTGKSLLARLIHHLSERKDQPFVRVDCGALPAALFESEVFGYEKGAFTGASINGKIGLFEMADGGTLFLDEVVHTPFEIQHKLLRFLESGEIIRVGSTKPINIDARVIAASNIDLEKAADSGKFRQDLYYRLKVVPMFIPPLQDRPEDIPFLIQYFLDKLNRQFNVRKSVSGPVLEAMIQYSWPGNVRELENLVERLVVMTTDTVIDITDLPSPIVDRGDFLSSFSKTYDMRESVKRFEAHLIGLALDKYGTQAKAAKALKVSQATIARKRFVDY